MMSGAVLRLSAGAEQSHRTSKTTGITAAGSPNMTSFDVVYMHSIRGIVHLPVNGPSFL